MPVRVSYSFWLIWPIPPSPTVTFSSRRARVPTGLITAAVVSPVGHLEYRGKVYEINGAAIGPVTHHLYDTLTGIQWGKLPDTHGWIVPVK